MGFLSSLPIKESHPLNPISPYGISKLAIEKYLGMYYHQYGLNYTVLRLSNPIGERQDPRRGQGVLAAWICQILRGEAIEIWGDGSTVRDYLYVGDAVDALLMALLHNSEEKTFNVGSGVGHSLLNLHQMLEARIKSPIAIRYRRRQKAGVPKNILDVARIKAAMGWVPKVTIEEAIEKMWNYYETS